MISQVKTEASVSRALHTFIWLTAISLPFPHKHAWMDQLGQP